MIFIFFVELNQMCFTLQLHQVAKKLEFTIFSHRFNIHLLIPIKFQLMLFFLHYKNKLQMSIMIICLFYYLLYKI
jgi:hypothetical protein